MELNRRNFLLGLAGIAGAGAAIRLGWQKFAAAPTYPVRYLGPSRKLGHMLRDHKIAASSGNAPRTKSKVAIIGGGMAGLSAAWWLQKHGVDDFTILELENEPGGNARSGKNEISAYPWGAHYVPLANPESSYVRDLFEELGIIDGHDAKGMPSYNELFLCHDPQERLFKDGTFQDGLVPKRGLQPKDQTEMARFFETVVRLRNQKGKDGNLAFAIPLDLSSEDEEFRALDQISMAEWLKQNNYVSAPLHWYVNYCCRDDYGSTLENVSAWAGLHYFAGRRGAASNAEMNSVITWPEGNGYLVNRLKSKLIKQLSLESMVVAVRSENEKVLIDHLKPGKAELSTIEADYAIFAAPRFLSKYLLPKDENTHVPELQYAPWLVANISVKHLPVGRGVDISWDNVNYNSDSLGYVVATHQNITTRESSTVLTFYYPLSAREPKLARAELDHGDAAKWSEWIAADLEKMHPGITKDITQMDIWPWGHGMIRPSVGYIWGDSRKRMKDAAFDDKVFFAHSDMSGISNFEEAQYHGVQAAEKILTAMKTT